MAGRKESGEKRRGIQSVEIGMRVLSAVAQVDAPSSLSAIAERSDLSASQTHRYLSSLMASGMVKQEGRSGLYDLDFGAIQIGLAALARIDTFARADEIFRELSRKTKRTHLIAVWGEHGPIVVRWYQGDPPVVTSLAIGSTLPVMQSATGRIFLGFTDHSLIREQMRKEARRLGCTVGDLASMREEIRKNMVAHVEGDLVPGLRAVAAPVFDLQGSLVFAASAIANGNFAEDDDEEAKDALVDACRQLTESLGGHWPPA